jgi:SRSO17 transposase
VAPQYSGTLGKIGSCQVVVSAEYLADDPANSTPFHWPISAQVFLPESWTQDAERRKQAQVPEEISQQTKPEMALGLLDRARQWEVPIQAVVVDAGSGDNPNFLQGLDARQVPYVCAVESTFGCRLPEEVQAMKLAPPVYQGRGQPRKPRPAPLYTVKALIEALPPSAWRTIAWREGTKGTMQVQAVALRVHWATGSPRHSTSHSRVQTGPEGWLLAERRVPETIEASPQPIQDASQKKEKEKIKYWFSVLPEDISLQRLVLLAHARWVIEQFYEDAKQECGLDHDQGRSWQGLHRHLALVMLAYSFLMLQRLTLPPSARKAFSPSGTRSSLPSVHRQVLLWLFQDLIRWLLSTQQFDSFCPRRNEQSSTRTLQATPDGEPSGVVAEILHTLAEAYRRQGRRSEEESLFHRSLLCTKRPWELAIPMSHPA